MQNNTGEIDLSMMPQREVSPSNPYVPGDIPGTPPLTLPNNFARPSRFTRFIRKLFFGDTQPGTDRGRTHAFKRGLMIAGGIAVVVAGIIAIVFVAKGVAFFSLVLPLAALVVACLVVAGAAMCCYHCVARLRGRHTVAHYQNVREVEHSVDHELHSTPGPWEYSGQPRPPGYPPEAPPVAVRQFGAQTYPTHFSRQQPSIDPAREVQQFSSSSYSVYGDRQQPSSTGIPGPGRTNFPDATAPAQDDGEEYKPSKQFG